MQLTHNVQMHSFNMQVICNTLYAICQDQKNSRVITRIFSCASMCQKSSQYGKVIIVFVTVRRVQFFMPHSVMTQFSSGAVVRASDF